MGARRGNPFAPICICIDGRGCETVQVIFPTSARPSALPYSWSLRHESPESSDTACASIEYSRLVPLAIRLQRTGVEPLAVSDSVPEDNDFVCLGNCASCREYDTYSVGRAMCCIYQTTRSLVSPIVGEQPMCSVLMAINH